MLNAAQAARLKEAGLTAYNHNLDTGPDYYKNIVTTRTYEDRLDTLKAVRGAGIEMCCGGILGMGESVRDRAAMLQVLAAFDPHPESVPINALSPVEGTPLGDRERIDPLEFVRMIATARIVLPASRVRLSAGRAQLSPRGANPLHGRRGQFDFLRRSAADDAECHGNARRRAVLRSRGANGR